jgi:type I restriction enzyme S subunit
MSAERVAFGALFAEPTRNGLTRPKAVRGSGVKMVNMGELFAHPRLANVPMDRVPVDRSELERFALRPDDLLFARQSLVLEGAGKCAIFLNDTEEVVFESHIIRVRLDPQRASPRYYFYYFQSHHGRSAIRSIVDQGAGASGIRGSDLQRLQVHWRPAEEQHAIASVLGALDDKIDLNRRMCQTLEEMARALFKSWFVDFDPVRAKMEGRDPGLPREIANLFPSRLVDSELGPIPEGWTTGHVGELAALNPESWTAKSRPGAVRYLDLASAKWGRFDEAQCLAGDAIPSRAQRVLKPGDSVVGTVRPGNGSFGLIHDDELTGSTGFAVLRPKATHNRVYVYLSVTAAENIDRLSRLADGGAYPAVRPDVVGASPCVHPPARLLEHVESIAGSWLDRVAACESESRSLAALRDTLLPKLISGEVRVSASLGSMQELSA